MARAKRGDVFDPTVVGACHCIGRCVRWCFLGGDDSLTGRNFDHRRRRLETRLELPAGCFAVGVLGDAVASLRPTPTHLDTCLSSLNSPQFLLDSPHCGGYHSA
ncbi:MAG: hypothetical protein RIC55_32550 [Pirellulaceae bacterium]